MAWPRIVAEALRRVHHPAQAAPQRLAVASAAATVEAMRTAQAPDRSAQIPPSFLLPHQHDPWRRVMATLDAWRGALLLEPVGRGKTWIALAVAAYSRQPVLAVVPAILQAQWSDAANRAGIRLQLWTHETTSRGRLPAVRPSLVIIDEAHRFRNFSTRRVRTLAPWVAGCRTLLLTGTPIVNRVGDLTALLRLILPEDVLALDGVARLEDIDHRPTPPVSLQRIAIRSAPDLAPATARRITLIAPDEAENVRGARAVAAIEELELSANPAIRRLVASVLLDAGASSDAALCHALRRYRALLLQARDAGGASRAMLRKFSGETLEQLVFWPLVGLHPVDGDLPIADLDPIERLAGTPPQDVSWIDSLRRRCNDACPTICFTRHRATAETLRQAFGEQTAWITGTKAGIGPHRMARAAVLAAFGPNRASWRTRRDIPRILIATDVAAEGLDLQSAGRVVHADLPWTATRVEQREGRLLRLGQQHGRVEILVRLPATAIETALAPHERVRRKRRISDVWLQALAGSGAQSNQDTGLICGLTDGAGIADLVTIQLRRGGQTGVMLISRWEGQPWRIDEAVAETLLQRIPMATATKLDMDAAAVTLAGAARAALQLCNGSGYSAPSLVTRIHRMARQAAARRDGPQLHRLDRLLRFATGSPTFGEQMIMRELSDGTDDDFLRRDVPDIPPHVAVQARIIAAVLFRPACVLAEEGTNALR